MALAREAITLAASSERASGSRNETPRNAIYGKELENERLDDDPDAQRVREMLDLPRRNAEFEAQQERCVSGGGKKNDVHDGQRNETQPAFGVGGQQFNLSGHYSPGFGFFKF